MVGSGFKVTTLNVTGSATGASSTTSVSTSKAASWFSDTFGIQLAKAQPKVQPGAGAAGEALLRLGSSQGGARLNLRALAETPPRLARVNDAGPAASPPAPAGQTETATPIQTAAAAAKVVAPSAGAAAASEPVTAAKAAETLRTLRGQLAEQRSALRGLEVLHASLNTPAGGKKTGERLQLLAEAQRELGSRIEARFGETAALLAAAKAEGADPALAALLPALREAQEALAYQAVLTQQPALGGRIESAPDRPCLGNDVRLVEAAIRELENGASTVPLPPGLDPRESLPPGEPAAVPAGRQVSFAELTNLVRDFGRDHAVRGRLEDVPTARHFSDLASRMEVAAETRAAAADLAALKESYPALDIPALTRQFRLALPPIDCSGRAGDVAKLRVASGGMVAFASLLRERAVPDALIGTNTDLNKALLAIKVAKARDQADATCRVAAETTMLQIVRGPLAQVDLDWVQREGVTEADIATARERGGEVAELRHELTLANRQLEALLETDRSAWFKPSTWGDKGRVLGHGQAGSARKDATFMTALRARGGDEAGRDRLLLIARISVLEEEVIRSEKEVLGLHEDFTFASAQGSDPLAFLGLTCGDLDSLGIRGEAAQTNLIEELRQIVGKGVTSLETVNAAVGQLNAARKGVLRSGLIQDTLKDFASESVQALATSFGNDLLADAYLTEQRIAGGPQRDAAALFEAMSTLSLDTPEVKSFLSRTGAALSVAAKPSGLGDALLEGAETFRSIETEIAKLASQRATAESQIETLKGEIAQARKDNTLPAERNVRLAERAALKAEVVVIDARIASHATRLDDIAARRQAKMGPLVSEARQLVRTALLATLPAGRHELAFKNGRVGDQLQPAALRGEVETRLREWGVDPELFAPELDVALYGTLTAGELALWRDETRISANLRVLDVPAPEAGLFLRDAVLGREDMDTSAKTALRSLVQGMAPDDKINLKSGTRLVLDTGSIPVDPYNIASLRLKLSGTYLNQVSLELGSDGFKLHVRTGLDGKGSLEAMAGKSYSVVGGGKAKLQAGGGGEAGGGTLSGWTLRFPNDPAGAGRERLIALLMKMADNQPIEPADLLTASDVAASWESSVMAGLFGKAAAEVSTKLGGAGPQFGLRGEVLASRSRTAKRGETENVKGSTRSGEVEISGTVSVSTQFYSKFHLGQVRTDMLGAGAEVKGTCTSKWKHERDENGRFTKAEITRQTNVGKSLFGGVALVGTAQVKARLASEDPKDKEFQTKFDELSSLMRVNDVLAVTYACGKAQLQRANDLLDEADALRRAGDINGAGHLEALADAVVSDPDNHAPAKVSLIHTNGDKREAGIVNLKYVRLDTVSDAKFEHPAAVISLAS